MNKVQIWNPPFFEIRIPHGTTSMIAEEYLDDTDFEVYQDDKVLKLIHHTILHEQKSNYVVCKYEAR